jgi:hypothetical protein
MAKDRYNELQENVRIIFFVFIQNKRFSFLLKIEKYGDGVDISILNHFTPIDMEASSMDDFFDQVIIFEIL